MCGYHLFCFWWYIYFNSCNLVFRSSSKFHWVLEFSIEWCCFYWTGYFFYCWNTLCILRKKILTVHLQLKHNNSANHMSTDGSSIKKIKKYRKSFCHLKITGFLLSRKLRVHKSQTSSLVTIRQVRQTSKLSVGDAKSTKLI